MCISSGPTGTQARTGGPGTIQALPPSVSAPAGTPSACRAAHRFARAGTVVCADAVMDHRPAARTIPVGMSMRLLRSVVPAPVLAQHVGPTARLTEAGRQARRDACPHRGPCGWCLPRLPPCPTSRPRDGPVSSRPRPPGRPHWARPRCSAHSAHLPILPCGVSGCARTDRQALEARWQERVTGAARGTGLVGAYGATARENSRGSCVSTSGTVCPF